MRINGFTQIKAFYSWTFSNQDKGVKPTHISLYLFLLNQNNRLNWVEWFKCPLDLGMNGSCISSKKTYYRCLKDLTDWGMIGYKKGANNWKAPMIKLVVLKDTSTVPLDTTQVPPLDTTQQNPFNITNNKELLNIKAEWKDSLCRIHKTNEKEINKHLEKFININIANGEIDRTEKDFRGHFINWLALQDVKKHIEVVPHWNENRNK